MLRIAITPSRYLALALAAVHAAAASAALFCPLHWTIRAALVVFVAGSLVISLRRHAQLRSAESIVAVEIADDGAWTYCLRDGTWREAKLLASTYVSPAVTVLGLGVPGSWLARHALIVPDNVDAGIFRRLRVAIRWPRRGGSGAGTAQF
jgi:toxin CptA